jgi:class 3 adenylate cyclase/DNA-binding SARP family transcriptional activator
MKMDFKILGPLEVYDEDRQLPTGGPKQRALLTILLLHAGEIVPTRVLVENLWGDARASSAEDAIETYVAQLRQVLGSSAPTGAKDLIGTAQHGYVLWAEPDDVDVRRFERLAADGRAALEAGEPGTASVKLREALALWRGPALTDLRHEPSAQPEVDRLDEGRLLALEDRIEADLELDRHREVVAELETLVAEHPLRARSRQLLERAIGGQPPRRTTWGRSDAPTPSGGTDVDGGGRSGSGGGMTEPPGEATAIGDELTPVTALFADIVGSTALAERMHPSEVRAVIGEAVSRMTRAAEGVGGTIQAYMGDGICAYFGVPVAHEDDPDRAARAALRICESIEEYANELESSWGISGFNVRVGINSGGAVIGSIGSASPQTVAFGDPLNVAARLESVAEPGTVAVGDAVARRLLSRFLFEPLGDVELKGRTRSVRAWRLVGVNATPVTASATPLVGRPAEMSVLRVMVDELRSGRGQVLMIEGDAGMGKTRTLAELRALAGSDTLWLEGRSLPFATELPCGPFVQILRQWLGVGDREPEGAVRIKLRARLETLFGDRAGEMLPFLGRFLAIRSEPAHDDLLTRLSPTEVADGVRSAYASWLEQLCAEGAVVVALDDVQSADDVTRELAEHLLPLADVAPILFVFTVRPDATSEEYLQWLRVIGHFHHRAASMHLRPLPDDAAATLVDALSPMGALDVETTAGILGRAEGNPLYVEELVRLLTESDGFERRERWTLSMTRSWLVLPPALEGLLVARVQRLPAGAKRLAQIGAVVGREFSLSMLRAVAEREDVLDDIRTLLQAEIIREVRRYPELILTYHHPLLLEAARSTLTPAMAKELYGKIARAFESIEVERAPDQLETLAFYFYRSDEPERAIAYLEEAGRQAADLDAASHSQELLDRAFRLAERVGDTDATERIRKLLTRPA